MVRYLFLSLNLLNSLLALAAAAVVYFEVIPIWDPVARISLPPVTETAASPAERAVPSQRFPMTDYAVISNKNLFHPDRKIPPEKQPEKIIPKPDLLLYGTLIAGDNSYAFIDDKKAPYSTPGRGKRQVTLKKGDHVSGYIVSEIEANRIVLVKGEEKVVVMLDDKEKRRTSEAPTVPAAARMDAGGIIPLSPAASSLPQPFAPPGSGVAIPGSRPPAQPVVSPSPQVMPSPAQSATMPMGGADPGAGLSTRRSRVQEIQKIKSERKASPEGSPAN